VTLLLAGLSRSQRRPLVNWLFSVLVTEVYIPCLTPQWRTWCLTRTRHTMTRTFLQESPPHLVITTGIETLTVWTRFSAELLSLLPSHGTGHTSKLRCFLGCQGDSQVIERIRTHLKTLQLSGGHGADKPDIWFKEKQIKNWRHKRFSVLIILYCIAFMNALENSDTLFISLYNWERNWIYIIGKEIEFI